MGSRINGIQLNSKPQGKTKSIKGGRDTATGTLLPNPQASGLASQETFTVNYTNQLLRFPVRWNLSIMT